MPLDPVASRLPAIGGAGSARSGDGVSPEKNDDAALPIHPALSVQSARPILSSGSNQIQPNQAVESSPASQRGERAEPEAPLRRRLRFIWLFYLVFFLMGPVLYAKPRDVAWAVVGVLLFLPLYFVAPRLRGWRALWPIAGMALIGVVYARHNPGASVFFVYAAAECMLLGSRRRAYLVIAALLALVVVVAVTAQAYPYFWIPALVLVVLIGLANLHQGELDEANREIRRSREEVERLARVAERERIARDLHDLLGHTLSLVVLKSELAARLAERDPTRAAAEIREVEAVARQALAEVRSAVASYRSETLRDELANARRALTAAGVALEVVGLAAGDGELDPPCLPPREESVLALILREAITNVVRHADATRCRVVVRREGDLVHLVVEDDGRGGVQPEGAGLRGMRERLAILGGALARRPLDPVSGRGTMLAIELPLGLGSGLSDPRTAEVGLRSPAGLGGAE